jgi:hypothetical protein
LVLGTRGPSYSCSIVVVCGETSPGHVGWQCSGLWVLDLLNLTQTAEHAYLTSMCVPTLNVITVHVCTLSEQLAVRKHSYCSTQ